MLILAGKDRRAAARLLAEYEANQQQPLAYQSPEIVQGTGQPDTGPGERVQVTSSSSSEQSTKQHGMLLWISTVRPRDLSRKLRLMWIVSVALAVALAFGALVSELDTFIRITGRRPLIAIVKEITAGLRPPPIIDLKAIPERVPGSAAERYGRGAP